MKRSKINLMIISILAVAMFVTACSGGSGDQQGSGVNNEDAVRVIVAGPMTGDNSEYGIGFANAADLMAEKWNAEATIEGKTVVVEKYDDKNSPEEAVTVANRIVSDGNIPVVIGHFASGVSMAAAPIYQDNQIIEISPSASHPDYSGIGDYIFRNNTVIHAEASASVDIAVNDLGKSNIGIISIMTDWGVSTSGIVKEIVENDFPGANIVAHDCSGSGE